MSCSALLSETARTSLAASPAISWTRALDANMEATLLRIARRPITIRPVLNVYWRDHLGIERPFAVTRESGS